MRDLCALLLGSLAALCSQSSFAGDIYLTASPTGPGNGTQTNPLDAGTADKLDLIYRTYSANTTFHYAAGAYETSGWHYQGTQTAQAKCVHIGAGIDRTIIRLVNASTPVSDGIIFGCDYNRTADGFSVQQLTLDVNSVSNPKFQRHLGATGAVNVNGSNILIKYVKVIGFGTSAPRHECFAVYCFPIYFHPGTTFRNVHVENCTFSYPATGNADGLSACVLGAGRNINYVDFAVLNSEFTNLRSDFSYSHAVGAPIVRGNFIENVGDGYYTEPVFYQSAPVDIENNIFVDVTHALFVNWHSTGSTKDYVFANNKVIWKNLQTGPGSVSIQNVSGEAGAKPSMTSLAVFGNEFEATEVAANHSEDYATVWLSPTNYRIGRVTVRNNRFTRTLPSGYTIIVGKSCADSYDIAGNLFSNGMVVQPLFK